MATATYGAFQVGPDNDCFTLELVYDSTSLLVESAIVTNTTADDQVFHLGDGANQANPVWTSAPIAPGTLTETLDISTTPGYSLIATPRGPRPVNCGNGQGS